MITGYFVHFNPLLQYWVYIHYNIVYIEHNTYKILTEIDKQLNKIKFDIIWKKRGGTEHR